MDNIGDNDQSGSDLESTVPVSIVNSSQLQLGTQPSVIQSVGGHIIQVASGGDASSVLSQQEGGAESKKRHDLLARRPSYRKIFNELSDTPGSMPVTKIEEESDSGDSDGQDSVSGGMQFSQPGQGTIQIAAHGDTAAQGIQTLTMSNINSTPQPAANSGATIVQYAQGPDGQYFIPVSTISAGNISYQMGIAPATSLGQNVVMTAAGGGVTSAGGTEEASRKRELRLLKNREAARECRRKKKEYIKCLENRVALLENQNKTLIEELKSLKELYCQKDTQS